MIRKVSKRGRSWRSRSAIVLKFCKLVAGNTTRLAPWRAAKSITLRSPRASAAARSAASATGHSPTVGWSRPVSSAAMTRPGRSASRVRSAGRNGVSQGTVSTRVCPIAAAQAIAARTPASGPGWPGRGSGNTGRPRAANRAGSPPAFSASGGRLRCQPGDDGRQQRATPERPQPLVAAAHPGRAAAGQDDGGDHPRHRAMSASSAASSSSPARGRVSTMPPARKLIACRPGRTAPTATQR